MNLVDRWATDAHVTRPAGAAPRGYAATTSGSVTACAVGQGGAVLGILWAADDEQAAGYVPAADSVAGVRAGAFMWDTARRLHGEGHPAAAVVTATDRYLPDFELGEPGHYPSVNAAVEDLLGT